MDPHTATAAADQVRPNTHSRTKSSFSIHSKTSDTSDNRRPKISAREASEAEKRHKTRFSTERAIDPNMAVRELEPGQRNLAEKVTLAPIRNLQWKDVYGNPITDPDASNPSRSRMERPLDTIRAFEAAIDGSYRKKPRAPRAESADHIQHYNESRRSSFVGNDPALNPRAPLSRSRHSAYPDAYGPSSRRPSQTRNSTAQGRMYSDGNSYPSYGYHESYETVGTGESYGSHSTEPWGNSTDPSSENSSIDRMHQQQLQQHGKPQYSQDSYDANGYPTPRSRQSPANVSPERKGYQKPPSPYRQQQQGGYRPGPPPVPEHGNGQGQRNVIALGGSAPPAPPAHAQYSQQEPARPALLQKQPSDKRKSWLKRRFSKG